MSSTPPPPSPNKPQPSQHAFQAPTGTRDFYPAELNRLRYIQDAWRKTSINHGFEEIDGPTFEHLELYTAKSGEGIVSELFSFERFGGEKTFALRPEFTPTLARMYASKAASLPKPTKWFWQQNCYRAERPQRGRLREFSQWNVDFLGGADAVEIATPYLIGDFEILACCIALLNEMGLTAQDVRVKINYRQVVENQLVEKGVPVTLLPKALQLLDGAKKSSREELSARAISQGIPFGAITPFLDSDVVSIKELGTSAENPVLSRLRSEMDSWGLTDWCEMDPGIVRGLAYYTGMVFEVHEATGAERAIAGGGRYDKLIETFGGPPTPAVGFGMGDVVLSLVLQDKGLMPKDDEIAERLGQRPDALVIAYEDKNDAAKSAAAEAAIAPTLAALRKGVDGKPGLHARRSYKTTKNVGKLIQDAAKIRARFCVIIESATTAQLKNMDTQEQTPVALSDLPKLIAKR